MSEHDQPRQNDAQPGPLPEAASNLELDWSQRFAHGMFDWALESRVTARELAMLRTMDRITDKPDWETRIFDDEVAASWKAEAVARELLMSRRAWEWCLEELRYKAGEFTRTGGVAVYDVGPRIVKSRLDCGRLKDLVKDVIDRADHGDGGQLDEDNQVLNIVDPSLYPLAYGVTEVLPDGEEVDPDNLWDKANKGQRSIVVPHILDDIFRQSEQDPEQAPDIIREQGKDGRWSPSRDGRWREHKPWRYSNRFQWLPSDVKFTRPDSDNCIVRLDSYISNLYPSSHRRLYSAIEDAISASIQPWNDTVTYAIPGSAGLGRSSPRIRAFNTRVMLPISPNGICWRKEGNFYKDLLDLSDAWETLDPPERSDSLDAIIARMDNAEHHSSPGGCHDLLREYRPEVLERCPLLLRPDWYHYRKHHPDIQARLEKFLHKEPGVCYSFEDWKAGKIPDKPIHWDDRMPGEVSSDDESDEAVRLKLQRQREIDACIGIPYQKPVKLCPHCPCRPSEDTRLTFFNAKSAKHEEGFYTQEEYDHEYRHAKLQSDFRTRGLQVYVKIQSVELTPGRPRYEGGDWALEGLLNEHIVASSICVFDVENVEEGGVSVSFSVEANLGLEEYDLEVSPGSESRKRLISMYAMDDLVGGKAPRWQVLGSVAASEGRVVSFPSTLQYRMGPVELRDLSKPGHVRFLTLCLADPNYRVVSTKRVVPQSFDWWEQDVFPWAFLMRKGLPDNVVRMIAEEARGEHIVIPDEARGFRSRMLWEKKRMMAQLNCEALHIDFTNDEDWSIESLDARFVKGDWNTIDMINALFGSEGDS